MLKLADEEWKTLSVYSDLASAIREETDVRSGVLRMNRWL